jgi:hypothetical protein
LFAGVVVRSLLNAAGLWAAWRLPTQERVA